LCQKWVWLEISSFRQLLHSSTACFSACIRENRLIFWEGTGGNHPTQQRRLKSTVAKAELNHTSNNVTYYIL
jgi:hypothetical protein